MKPPRAGHCDVCRRCVRGFDHHCNVCDLCVGARSLYFFYAMFGAWITYVVATVLVGIVHVLDVVLETTLSMKEGRGVLVIPAGAALVFFLSRPDVRSALRVVASCDWFQIYSLRHDLSCFGCAAPLCAVLALGAVAALASVRVDGLPGDFRGGTFFLACLFCLGALVIAPCGLSLAWFFCDGAFEGITSKVLWRRRKEEAKRDRAASYDAAGTQKPLVTTYPAEDAPDAGGGDDAPPPPRRSPRLAEKFADAEAAA